MKAVVVAMSLLSSTLLVAGCTAEMAPEDEALLEEDQGDQATSSEQPADEESVGEVSEAVCSCATELHCSHGQLTVYENSDCCGGNFFFCPGNYPDLSKYTTNLWWGANWNDRISRLNTTGSPNKKVGVYVYQHVNYGGDWKYFPPGTFKDIGGSLWNDKISSIKVIALP